ncbi:MAG TPA: peptide deformylase [Armatimonadota bacterium]|jgi:peptide deformylase
MAVRDILRLPDSRLREKCLDVNPGTLTQEIARDLLDTMNSVPGVGVAAPQIGCGYRVVLVDAGRNAKCEEHHGLLILVNPVISASSGSQVFKEGCLSVPQYLARIKRAWSVTVEAVSPSGEPVHIEARGFEAVVLQHEIDHLDGILFLDRVRDMKRDLFDRVTR